MSARLARLTGSYFKSGNARSRDSSATTPWRPPQSGRCGDIWTLRHLGRVTRITIMGWRVLWRPIRRSKCVLAQRLIGLSAVEELVAGFEVVAESAVIEMRVPLFTNRYPEYIHR